MSIPPSVLSFLAPALVIAAYLFTRSPRIKNDENAIERRNAETNAAPLTEPPATEKKSKAKTKKPEKNLLKEDLKAQSKNVIFIIFACLLIPIVFTALTVLGRSLTPASWEKSFGFASALILPTIILWAAVAGILVYAKKKKTTAATSSAKQQLGFLLIAFMGIAVWFIFFEDRDFLFECRKETMTCNYYHSTQANKELRLVRSYDISNALYAKVNKKTVRSGKRHRTYYEVVFVKPENSVAIPREFHIYDAPDVAKKVNRFLQSDLPVYRYADVKPKDDDSTVLTVFLGILDILGFIAMIVLISSLRSALSKASES